MLGPVTVEITVVEVTVAGLVTVWLLWRRREVLRRILTHLDPRNR